MTADIVHLADYRAAAPPAPSAGSGNAAAAAAMLVAACHMLAVSLAQIDESCTAARDRMKRLHHGAEAIAADAGEVIEAAQNLSGLGRSLRGAGHE